MAVIFGVPMLVAGVGDSMRMHPASTWELPFGMILVAAGMFLFVAARVITLLAEIAHNTARLSGDEA
jgi:hypothetical protein